MANKEAALSFLRMCGDLAAVHSHVRMKPGDKGIAVVHLLRFEGGRVAEFWDVGQAVPEESPNRSGMF